MQQSNRVNLKNNSYSVNFDSKFKADGLLQRDSQSALNKHLVTYTDRKILQYVELLRDYLKPQERSAILIGERGGIRTDQTSDNSQICATESSDLAKLSQNIFYSSEARQIMRCPVSEVKVKQVENLLIIGASFTAGKRLLEQLNPKRVLVFDSDYLQLAMYDRLLADQKQLFSLITVRFNLDEFYRVLNAFE